MEQSGTLAPQEPIIVLGKQNNYFFVGNTVDHAVKNTCHYLAAESCGCQDAEDSTINRFRLDELEFFDSAGRRLEPVVVEGQLTGLTVKDPQEEIRGRPGKMFLVIEVKTEQEPHPDVNKALLSFPDASISFEELIQQLVIKDPPVAESFEVGGVHGVLRAAASGSWICNALGYCYRVL